MMIHEIFCTHHIMSKLYQVLPKALCLLTSRSKKPTVCGIGGVPSISDYERMTIIVCIHWYIVNYEYENVYTCAWRCIGTHKFILMNYTCIQKRTCTFIWGNMETHQLRSEYILSNQQSVELYVKIIDILDFVENSRNLSWNTWNNLTTDPNTKPHQKYADRSKHISTQTLILLNKPIWAKSDTNVHTHYVSQTHTDTFRKSNTPEHTQNLTNAWVNTRMPRWIFIRVQFMRHFLAHVRQETSESATSKYNLLWRHKYTASAQA